MKKVIFAMMLFSVPSSFEGELRLEHNLSPYFISAPGIHVEEGNILTIEPGTKVSFGEKSGIFLNGGTANISGNLSGDDGWLGISGKGTINITDLSIDGANSGISISDSELTARSLKISNTKGVAASLLNVSGSIQDSVIFNNSLGLNVINSPNLLISSNTITQNDKIINAYLENGAAFSVGNNYWGTSGQPLFDDYEGNVDFYPVLEDSPQGFYPCCSTPLFFPGFQGTRLNLGDNQLWEPNRNADAEKLFIDDDGLDITPGITVGSIIKKTNIGFGLFDKPIYQGISGLFDQMVSDGDIQTWKEMPYDWRLDLPISNEIFDAIYHAAKNSKTGQVILVGHSNGGLMIKKLLASMSESFRKRYIDSAILVATPQTGAPQAISGMLHGDDQSIGLGLILNSETARDLGKGIPGSYNLLPSLPLYSSSSPFVIFASSTDIYSNLRSYYGDSITEKTSMDSFLSGNLYPAILKKDLIDNSHQNHLFLDSFNSDIPIHQMSGTGFPTTSGIEYSGKKNCNNIIAISPLLCVEESELIHTPLKTLLGDGTVPLQSANYMTQGKSFSYIIDIGEYNRLNNKNYSHGNILEVPLIKQKIKEIILNFVVPQAEASSFIFQYIIRGNAEFDIYNQNLHTGIEEQNIPNSSYEGSSDQQIITIANPEGPVEIEVIPKEVGVSLEIIQTNETSRETVFSKDIVGQEGSTIKFTYDINESQKESEVVTGSEPKKPSTTKEVSEKEGEISFSSPTLLLQNSDIPDTQKPLEKPNPLEQNPQIEPTKPIVEASTSAPEKPIKASDLPLVPIIFLTLVILGFFCYILFKASETTGKT